MSKRRLPEVELNPAGLTPVQPFASAGRSRQAKSQPKPIWLKAAVLLFLALFVLSTILALAWILGHGLFP